MSSLIKETGVLALKGFALAGGATVAVFVAIEMRSNAKERKRTPHFYGPSKVETVIEHIGKFAREQPLVTLGIVSVVVPATVRVIQTLTHARASNAYARSVNYRIQKGN